MFDSAALRREDAFAHRHPAARPAASRPAASRPATVVPLPNHGHDAATHQSAGTATVRRTIELNLLGGFRLFLDGDLIQVGLTGQRLLAALACRGRQATRRQIAYTLWPDVTSARAHANLRTALYRLGRSAPGVVFVTTSYLQLPVGAKVDLEQSSRLAKSLLSVGDTVEPADSDLLSDALQVNLYDDLLPDWDDEWLADHQSRYRQLRLTALEALSYQLAAVGRHGAAMQTALAAVQADSLRDSAYETLIRTCLAQGNRHEALVHYSTYRRVLREELGLEPPASIGQLLSNARSTRPTHPVRPAHSARPKRPGRW